MDDQLRKLLQFLVEKEESPILIVGGDEESRTDWALSLLSERESIGQPIVLETDRDWERAVDDEADAVVVPEVTAVSDDRQTTLLKWLTEGTRVVAAGASDPDQAIADEQLRVDLYYRLNVTPFPLEEFDATQRLSPREAIERAIGEDTGRESGRERSLPPEWLVEWCERAEVEPTRAWRHSHLEDGELWSLEIASPSADEAWRRLSRTGGDIGRSPVVTPDADAVDTLLQRQHFDHDAISPRTADWRLNDWRDAVAGVDVDGWVQTTIEREKAEGRDTFFDPEPFERLDRSDEESSILRDAETNATLTIVPVEASWEVPAFFHYGGYNANPSADRHVAVLRRWADRWGATLFAITPDRIELYLEDPVDERDEALEVAPEHYVYCTPGLAQNISQVARNILGSHWWTFWWD